MSFDFWENKPDYYEQAILLQLATERNPFTRGDILENYGSLFPVVVEPKTPEAKNFLVDRSLYRLKNILGLIRSKTKTLEKYCLTKEGRKYIREHQNAANSTKSHQT